MDPFQIKFHDARKNKNPHLHISELPDFRKIDPYSSGDNFSESCSPRKMMQNGIDEIFWGQTFKNTSYFTLRTFGSLLPRSWYQDLGTRILVSGSWYQDLGTRILVPRSWCQDPGTRILVPESWYQDLGPRYLSSLIRTNRR